MEKKELFVVAFEHQVPRFAAGYIFHNFTELEDDLWKKMSKYINEQDQRNLCPLR